MELKPFNSLILTTGEIFYCYPWIHGQFFTQGQMDEVASRLLQS